VTSCAQHVERAMKANLIEKAARACTPAASA